MKNTSFDTYKYIKNLVESGLQKEQAEIIVQGLLENRQYNSPELATIKESMVHLESKLRAEINHGTIKAQLAILEWMMKCVCGLGIIISIVAMVIIAVKILH